MPTPWLRQRQELRRPALHLGTVVRPGAGEQGKEQGACVTLGTAFGGETKPFLDHAFVCFKVLAKGAGNTRCFVSRPTALLTSTPLTTPPALQMPLTYQPVDQLFCVRAKYEPFNPSNPLEGLKVNNYGACPALL